MTRKKDFIKAGAAYRLSKHILAEMGCILCNSLRLNKEQWLKVQRAISKWYELECAIGFENMVEPNIYGQGILNLFYGSINGSPRTETDKAVLEEIKSMLEKMIKEVEKALNEN